MRALAVFRDGSLVGRLRDRDDEIEFEYAAEYLDARAVPISASLSLHPPLTRGPRARAFFSNLLPEGALRSVLAGQLKVDVDDDIGLLRRVGADCAGALVIVPEGEQPQKADAPFEQRYVALEDEYEFGQYLEALSVSPMATFKGVATRMSLAGAQDKTAVARFGGSRIYRSRGGATTHIVKLGSRLDTRGDEVYPGVVFNEYFCSKLALTCGIPIRPVELLPYRRFRDGPSEFVFCIERYDRAIDFQAREVRRLHQEDFCQVLGRPRTQKYEAQAGISLADMFRLASDPDQITVPAIARKRLLDLVLFNLVIGNRDSHAKNYALLRHGSKAELAPAYDLVCTEIYENLDRSLPQKIGDAGQLEAITPGDLAVFAEQIELRPRVVRRELVKAAKTVANALPTVVEQLTSRAVADEARDVIAKVQKRIRSNTKATRKIAR